MFLVVFLLQMGLVHILYLNLQQEQITGLDGCIKTISQEDTGLLETLDKEHILWT